MTTDMPRIRRELSADDKLEVVKMLQRTFTKGKLAHGAISATAAQLNLHRSTVSSLWSSFSSNEPTSNKPGRVGRKPVYTADEITAMANAVPHSQRSTLRDISEATGLSLGTLSRSLKVGIIQRRSSRLKPLLTDANKLVRVASGVGNLAECQFDDMWDVVHLDEKWFNADKDRRKVYLLTNGSLSRRAFKSKRFIPKVMFLAAVARPRVDDDRGVLFNGKVGMWPFVKQEPATRNSRNRATGTMVSTLVNVNADVYCDFVLHKVVPAIKANFPSAYKGSSSFVVSRPTALT
ncbi:hypothetical protein H310_03906 [Aphanomyces invadans]|uniref:Transposase Tc1-like domain-containing protein n=1 Tax=Aphanomyces invadans TaxID=157072 RepID=A0A024UGI9_9STRA|nr:hypothetical protein H310_03906 [Aphanomyces invadans]ETW04758.1 hypothetical protein H310_03906 [Aphanomyces invadans]|eukprot:XP_008866196.1 hypothetical protein H310_03906 [Aphanomyces invadans]